MHRAQKYGSRKMKCVEPTNILSSIRGECNFCYHFVSALCCHLFFAAWNLPINNMWPSGATKKEIRSISTYISHCESHSLFALMQMHHSPNADVGIWSSFFPEVVRLSFHLWDLLGPSSECKLQRLSLPPEQGLAMAKWQACFLCGAPDHELPSCLEARWEKTRFQVHHEIAQIPKMLLMVLLGRWLRQCQPLTSDAAGSKWRVHPVKYRVTVLEDRLTGFFEHPGKQNAQCASKLRDFCEVYFLQHLPACYYRHTWRSRRATFRIFFRKFRNVGFSENPSIGS